jgi:hypothetical protein
VDRSEMEKEETLHLIPLSKFDLFNLRISHKQNELPSPINQLTRRGHQNK